MLLPYLRTYTEHYNIVRGQMGGEWLRYSIKGIHVEILSRLDITVQLIIWWIWPVFMYSLWLAHINCNAALDKFKKAINANN